MEFRRRLRQRSLAMAATLAAGTLLLSACSLLGGDDGTGSAQETGAVRANIECAEKGKVLGAGSTAQQNAMKLWTKTYQDACKPVQVAYWAQGSTAGVSKFLLGNTAFGGSDSPLKPSHVEQSQQVCPGGRAIDLPMLGGPIAIGYNLSNVPDLVLDAPTLAKIFDAKITTWNDPAIQALNPGAALPALPINAVHRTDGSGTTKNFAAYLAGAAPKQWPYTPENEWKGQGGSGASGSENLANQVQSTDGAIGYFELSFATARKMHTVKIATGAPQPVPASVETATAGIATAELVGEAGDLTLKLDYATKNDGAYPIVLITYEIVCNKGNKPETLPALKSFLTYTASEKGQAVLADAHYSRLPPVILTKVRQAIETLS
ncbi:Phosphate-binding protein PstS 2 precursor [Streptomyces sp. ADI95-16]|uniref:phosphate ABC transporter substrate-binding protein PstS n=1 Tax=Streptomyces sp. ADI95-16 TaxID=1522758 RepID=UPI000F3A8CA7|nr:phosphate ABC transporter substrate-binding protein PstS [Streptomyces sp. ADI95-16]AYV26236.1 Phosphate-binding protein PstS 2 precursor [Streptomyces sp. ADI95-16]